jgi:rare lipoprotein A
MPLVKTIARLALTIALAGSIASLGVVAGESENKGKPDSDAAKVGASASNGRRPSHSRIDRSGRKQSGMASYYGKSSTNKKTADGERLDPGKMTAASETLPLGTRAKVTNTDNGKSVDVTINDRGPAVKGRILDVTPKAAEKLGMKSDGVSPVEIKPLEVPQPDGQIKHLGD